MAKPQIGVSHCIHISLSFITFDYITQYIKNKLPKIFFFLSPPNISKRFICKFIG